MTWWWAEHGHITAPLLSLIFTIGMIIHDGFGKNSALIILFPALTVICNSKIMDIDWIYRYLKLLCESPYLKTHKLCVIILALFVRVFLRMMCEHHIIFFSIQVFFFFPSRMWMRFYKSSWLLCQWNNRRGNQVTKHSFFLPFLLFSSRISFFFLHQAVIIRHW